MYIYRKKSKKNAPRVCDIDLISYFRHITSGNITLPHKSMHKRNFVLFPMFDLNKHWIHPKNKKKHLFF